MVKLNESAPVTYVVVAFAEGEGVPECEIWPTVLGEAAEPEADVRALVAKQVDLVPAQRGPYYGVGLQTGVDQKWCVLRSRGDET